MNVCIDAGNTMTKIGYLQSGELIKTDSIPTKPPENLYKVFSGKEFDRIIWSDVSNAPSHVINYLKNKAKDFISLSRETSIPIKILYKKDENLGSDRIALATGAWALYPDTDNLIVSAGTCITYDFVTRDGSYQGGAISPGIQMRFKALHEFSAKLPLVNINEEPPIINGRSTSECSGCRLKGSVTSSRSDGRAIKSIEGAGSAACSGFAVSSQPARHFDR